jgi:hypothetical protein
MGNRENDDLNIEESSIKEEEILNEMLWISDIIVITDILEDTKVR